MEQKEMAIIQELIEENRELKKLMEEHEEYEHKLEEFNNLKYLSSEQELERKRIQKLKLAGKDRIAEIIRESQKA